MSRTVVKVGNIEYEPEALTALTEPSAKRVAFSALGIYQENRKWEFSEEDKKWNSIPLKEERDRQLFWDLGGKIAAILMSDKNGVFDSVEQLMDMARESPDNFLKLYQAAIEANPNLKDKSDESEATADPN